MTAIQRKLKNLGYRLVPGYMVTSATPAIPADKIPLTWQEKNLLFHDTHYAEMRRYPIGNTLYPNIDQEYYFIEDSFWGGEI